MNERAVDTSRDLVTLTFDLLTLNNCPLRVRSFRISTVRGELQRLLPNLNALVAISKGMRPVKLCTDKILQFCHWRAVRKG